MLLVHPHFYVIPRVREHITKGFGQVSCRKIAQVYSKGGGEGNLTSDGIPRKFKFLLGADLLIGHPSYELYIHTEDVKGGAGCALRAEGKQALSRLQPN